MLLYVMDMTIIIILALIGDGLENVMAITKFQI